MNPFQNGTTLTPKLTLTLIIPKGQNLNRTVFLRRDLLLVTFVTIFWWPSFLVTFCRCTTYLWPFGRDTAPYNMGRQYKKEINLVYKANYAIQFQRNSPVYFLEIQTRDIGQTHGFS